VSASSFVRFLGPGGSIAWVRGRDPRSRKLTPLGVPRRLPACSLSSPNVGQIKKALETVNTEAGTLIVIMQYTGDVLHFGLAGEQFRAQNPNSKVRLLAVGDDISVGRAQGKMVGRRGMAGTVLCYKLGGALAAKGGDLDAVYNVSQFVADRTATIGAGLDHTHIPGTGPSETHLASDQVEVGMGIHNEPGLETAPLTTTKALVQKMIDLATNKSDEDRSFVPFQLDGKDEVVLMVNNLGSISELELGGVTGTALEILGEMKIKVRRVLAGTFMTSLNMPGFSVSLFLLPRESESTGYKTAELLELLDADGDAPGWKWHSKSEPGDYSPPSAEKSTVEEVSAHKSTGKVIKPTSGKAFIDAIVQACKDVKAAEPEITRMDTIAGDGDCGTTLDNGANGILKAIEDKRVSETDVIQAVLTIAEQVRDQNPSFWLSAFSLT
jgi:dihydroxyacetone kinase